MLSFFSLFFSFLVDFLLLLFFFSARAITRAESNVGKIVVIFLNRKRTLYAKIALDHFPKFRKIREKTKEKNDDGREKKDTRISTLLTALSPR